MEFTGEHLKATRAKREYSISEVSKELKISEDILLAIEKDDFPEYINITFLIGHIRAYAKLLDLNDNEIVENFKLQTSYQKSDNVKKISKPFISKNSIFQTKILSFASIIIIALGFYYLFIKPNNLDPIFAMTPELPENLRYDIERIEMNEILLNKSKQQNKNNSIDENIFIQNNSDEILITPSSAIASVPKKNINNLSQEISLKFLNSTWIQLRDENNEIIISKLMNQGDEYSYSVSEKLNLTAGNAGNIIIAINGVVMGKAGKVGEVIDSLIIDQDFKN